MVVYRALRAGILEGEYRAGDVVSQVKLAEDHGVSRGPVREALRLLQQEGLIDAVVNHRARVAALSAEDLEGIYAQRILIESLACTASVPRFTEEDLEALRSLVHEMDEAAGVDLERWTDRHTDFHRRLVVHSGIRLRDAIEYLFQHSERYRRIYLARGPRMWTAGSAEHHEILESCLERDAREAGARLGRHLSRTAATVLLTIAPEHEPRLMRQALLQVLGTVEVPPARPAASTRPGAAP